MKTKRIDTGQVGFTLVEVLIAMAIFTIGILGLFGMQSAVITKNVSANTITSGATWTTDRLEMLLGQDYVNLVDRTKDGCDGMNDRTDTDADGSDSSGTVPEYKMYWNVAKDCLMIRQGTSGVPDSINEREEQKPKYIRVIVTVDRGAGEQDAAVFNYIKQNVKQQN